MAKSKVGGTRAYIRGRIGSDVYSVGKNGKGARQQVVRSLAEQVSNPRTSSQMFGRMIMSSVMQAVSALKPIIDHSFDGVPTGQPSISEFIRQNYALIKADAIAHPASSNAFGLCKYQEKGVKVGAYVLSAGNVTLPSGVSYSRSGVQIAMSGTTYTVGDVKAKLGFTSDGYLTMIVISSNNGAQYCRYHINPEMADNTQVTEQNINQLFVTEGSATFEVEEQGGFIAIKTPSSLTKATVGMIISDKLSGSWVHSACTMVGDSDNDYNANAALLTYPTGVAQFLNGGDL